MKLFGKEITFSKPPKTNPSPYYPRPQKVTTPPIEKSLEIVPEVVQIEEPIIVEEKETKLEIKIKKYKVTGMSYRLENLLSLSLENEDYDLSKKLLIEKGYENERVYQYEFYPIKTELVPEPDNPHDPNAIKVIVDGVHVGYIKSGSCSHVHKLLKENRIEKIECRIGGGKYKYIGYDEDDDKYYLEKDESPFFVHLSISEK